MKFRALMPFIIFPAIIYFLSYYGTPISWISVLSVFSGFLIGGLPEYFVHRFAFHNRKLSRKVKKLISYGHTYHHRYPQLTEDLILPLTIVLPISLVLLCLFTLVFGTAYVFWFYTGLMSSYFLYEAMHYLAHHSTINLPYFKQMREHHLAHHKSKPNSKFSITNPLYDWLFGTLK